MAEIPSDIASSAAQTGHEAREVSQAREARRVQQAQAADRHIKAVDEAGNTVDTDDASAFADSEGAGSEGRAFEEEDAPSREAGEDSSKGITKDDTGRLHLDLEA